MQGDITAIYNSIGTKLVSYTYTAWGTTTITYSNGGASTTAVNNNLTYRGYYYDADLGMYYLQSRYYDANICRFINADSLVAGVSNSTSGFNLYVYCFNNPIAFTDDSGNWPKIRNVIKAVKEVAKKVIQTVVSTIIDEISQDFKTIDFNNTSPSVVYNSENFSWYKGTLVIKHSSDKASSCAILDIIFLKDADYGENPKDCDDTLNHEYGHILQEKEMGTIIYFVAVAIPSLSYNYLVPEKYHTEEYFDYYYSMPWEHDADKRMSVVREKTLPYADEISDIYFSFWRLFYD